VNGIVLGLIIGIPLGYWFKGRNANIEPAVTNTNMTTDNSTSPLYVETETKTVQAGVITDIKGKTIYIDGEIIQNGQIGKQNFAVETNNDTVFKRIDNNNNIFEDMSLNDLKTGDQITAISAEDFKGRTEFTATQINYYLNN
jgi:hypothetical protein